MDTRERGREPNGTIMVNPRKMVSLILDGLDTKKVDHQELAE